MNTASQNLEHHLGILREKLQHPTDYELAISYFLEEFAGDEAFVLGSQTIEAPHLLAVVAHVAGKTLGKRIELGPSRVLYLPQFRFYHGNALVEGRVALFVYFEEFDTGVMILMQFGSTLGEYARFRLTGCLPGNPVHN